MTVHLLVEHGPHGGLPGREVLRRVQAMCRALQLDNVELSLLLTNDAKIRILNRLYRNEDRPTDVLAFAMREGPGPDDPVNPAQTLLGDVVVSVPRARAQAASRGVSVLAEVTMLVAHGLLHLLGWDHDTKAKERRMRAETERLCAAAARGASTRASHRAPPKSRRRATSRHKGDFSAGSARRSRGPCR